ncbi:D-alanyl-D-alanine carboxypeptidase family protein [Planomicrobium sp. YIM 101495]|uniref:M15 family metallopeptidase n=1 Tax=Planomicrobium sp. YIM 101495 TaxID=2665160 RepID=UPI0012B6C711|nr:M15 family metallopeptidase [Planomicrobium sp. YIM 101495]MTD31170.1 D-Ala-D-Ala carboxypeptidase VanY [Planomicrobium sp. YIM 101495]
MKKWALLCVLVASAGLFYALDEPFSSTNTETPSEEVQELQEAPEEPAPEPERKIELTEVDIRQGNLLLVNQDYPVLPESIRTDVIDVLPQSEWTDGYALLSEDIQLSEDLVKRFSEMVAVAKQDGIDNFLLTSGFRSFEEQEVLFAEMGADYALPPGYSEHNLGLSLDVSSTEMLMEVAPEGRWVADHAWEFGFVVRYPADKTEITGIQYEPWHLRYVGLPHSAIMKEKNFVLEEYLAYLKEEQEISAQVDGEIYTVTYHPVNGSTTVTLPPEGTFELSGTNVDGVILTLSESDE